MTPDNETPPMELWRAVVFALKTLRDPNANQQTRNLAADELQISFESQDDKK